jgi:hypothetical protein
MHGRLSLMEIGAALASWFLLFCGTASAVRGGSSLYSMPRIAMRDNADIFDGMDERLKRKLQIAFDSAGSVAKEKHPDWTLAQRLEFIAEYLLWQDDPELREFQLAHERELERRSRQTRKDLN